MVRPVVAAALVAFGLARAANAGPSDGLLPTSAAPPRATPLPAPAPIAPAPDGEQLSVYVMTFGPGDHPFLRFGHNAILIRDRVAGTDRVYNFGTFSFDSPRLILDFLGGRMMYWLSVASLPAVVSEYKRENRTIAVQELRLDPTTKEALQAALQVNARRENRAYKYDYFLDNCSTRVRDALVAVAPGGSLREVGAMPGRMSLRQHALRMTAGYFPLYLALDLVLGPAVDRPTDRWAEMFLPDELAHALAEARIAPPGAASGPMVARETVMFSAVRAPTLQTAPAWTKWFALAGAAVGMLFLMLGRGAARRRWLRVVFGALVAVWGLVVGFIGCFLAYAWVFTDHLVAHRNQNTLLAVPWAIGLAVLGLGIAFGSRRSTRAAFWLAALALAASAAALVMKVGLGPWQDNRALIAFFLPAWLGVTAALGPLRLEALKAGGRSRP